jgi:hypothetical protein
MNPSRILRGGNPACFRLEQTELTLFLRYLLPVRPYTNIRVTRGKVKPRPLAAGLWGLVEQR